MYFTITRLIATLLLLLTFTAALPTPNPAPSSSCTKFCCQSIHDPNNMAKLLTSLHIARSDISGLMGLGCTPGDCPSSTVGVQSCCSGATMARVVTSECVPVSW